MRDFTANDLLSPWKLAFQRFIRKTHSRWLDRAADVERTNQHVHLTAAAWLASRGEEAKAAASRNEAATAARIAAEFERRAMLMRADINLRQRTAR